MHMQHVAAFRGNYGLHANNIRIFIVAQARGDIFMHWSVPFMSCIYLLHGYPIEFSGDKMLLLHAVALFVLGELPTFYWLIVRGILPKELNNISFCCTFPVWLKESRMVVVGVLLLAFSKCKTSCKRNPRHRCVAWMKRSVQIWKTDAHFGAFLYYYIWLRGKFIVPPYNLSKLRLHWIS